MRKEELLLLNPGPVPVSNRVRQAMDQPLISHRSAAFEAIYERAQDGLETIFTQSTPAGEQTSEGGEALLLNGTATMAMEAAVANLVDPDDQVTAIVNGKFGRRFARIADRYANCERIETEWGQSIDIAEVTSALSPETDLVTLVHNETSTGVQNPVGEIGELTREIDAHFVVDGVTSIGGEEFRIDDWHVDIAVTDAQKALAAPPGISGMYIRNRALEAIDASRAPFYQDLEWHLQKAKQHQTPFTSAVSLFRAMAEAVDAILEEGLPERIERHHRQAAAFRAAFEAMGLERFPKVEAPTTVSNTVTAIELPPAGKASPDAFFEGVAQRNVSISGGQAHLGGEIFRVSNMGDLDADDIERGVAAIAEALEDIGVSADPSGAVAAASDILNT